ncbi:CPBP family intramembrane glutamic endopeptidase [Verrucomicrobiota bacterium]
MNNKRKFSLTIYLLIVFTLSWPFQIVSAIWAKSLPTLFLLNSISMIMVAVGTFIAGKYVFGDGFAGMGWRWGRLKYHLAVIGLAALLWIVPTIIDLVMGTLKLPNDLQPIRFGLIFLFPVITLLPGFGEEFGWRGYMLPRLALKHTGRKAVLLHCIIWWAWHWPLLIGLGTRLGMATAAQQTELSAGIYISIVAAGTVIASALPAIMHGVVFAYIWMRSRSLAVATVYHATYDGFRDSIGTIVGLGPIAGAWANVVLIFLGITLLWKADWSVLSNNSELKKEA